MQNYAFLLRIRPVELAQALKSVLKIRRREYRIGEYLLWLDPVSDLGYRILNQGEYEPEMISVLTACLTSGSIFVDLGTNEGYLSLRASKLVGPKGHVYSIEPQSRLWPVIIKNLLLNRATNYTLIPYAVSEAEGNIDMVIYPSINTGASSAVRTLRTSRFETERCAALPLSDIIDRFNIPAIDLMKIDIEGFELNALRSLGRYLAQGVVKRFIIEVHPRQMRDLGQSPDELSDLMRRSGYRRIESEAGELWEFESPDRSGLR
jgi:FkbM family methyltransferase